jgi:hypothetical protein
MMENNGYIYFKILWLENWMKLSNVIACNLNWIQMQLKRSKMQIGAQGICLSLSSYLTMVLKLFPKRHLFIPFIVDSKLKSILVGWVDYWSTNSNITII